MFVSEVRRVESRHMPAVPVRATRQLTLVPRPSMRPAVPVHAATGTVRAAVPTANKPPVMHRDVSTRLGERIRALRLARGMTQTRMAEVFDIDRTWLSDLERGQSSISLLMMAVVARGFRLTLSELLRGV